MGKGGYMKNLIYRLFHPVREYHLIDEDGNLYSVPSIMLKKKLIVNNENKTSMFSKELKVMI